MCVGRNKPLVVEQQVLRLVVAVEVARRALAEEARVRQVIGILAQIPKAPALCKHADQRVQVERLLCKRRPLGHRMHFGERSLEVRIGGRGERRGG